LQLVLVYCYLSGVSAAVLYVRQVWQPSECPSVTGQVLCICQLHVKRMRWSSNAGSPGSHKTYALVLTTHASRAAAWRRKG